MNYRCTKYHTPFAKHSIHWWCFVLPKHYTYARTIKEDGTIIDTPISFRDYLRDNSEEDEENN